MKPPIRQGDPREASWKPYPKASDPILFDMRGARRTASLFFETTSDEQLEPVFTLRDYEKRGLPSAYLLYMESETEYDAAMKLVGSMGHWRTLCAKPWFMTGDPDKGIMGLEQWRLDMAARDSTQAMTVIKDFVSNGDKQAAQFLLNYATKGDFAGKGAVSAAKKIKSDKKKREKVTDLSDVMAELKAVPKGD